MKKSILFGALAFFAISALGIQDAMAQNDDTKTKKTDITSVKEKEEKPTPSAVDQKSVKQKKDDCCADKKTDAKQSHDCCAGKNKECGKPKSVKGNDQAKVERKAMTPEAKKEEAAKKEEKKKEGEK